jgi:hypothetical protein
MRRGLYRRILHDDMCAWVDVHGSVHLHPVHVRMRCRCHVYLRDQLHVHGSRMPVDILAMPMRTSWEGLR